MPHEATEMLMAMGMAATRAAAATAPVSASG